jgi:signal transduction histidine kinase
MKLLHIEDRRENRLLVRKLLEIAGHEVVDTTDGLSGVQLAATAQPELVLVDINLPGLDGYEVVTKLRGMPALENVPIVAVTAEGDRDRALALGFDGFIAKPIQVGTFEAELRAFLTGRRERIAEGDRARHLEDQNRRTVDRLEEKVRALTIANERLREVDKLKMEVLRNVSHELATPMTPLIGYAKMLERAELGPVSEAQARTLERMRGSLVRLNTIIQNLLAVTRFATGSVTLERTAVSCSRLIEDAIARNAAFARERETTLAVAATLPTEPVLADAPKLVDALSHLVDNALKFSPTGSRVDVEATILVDGEGDRRILEITVVDDGPGIPAGLRERVVEPFYQADGSPTRAAGGAGLGLAIAERTAALHGGQLRIEDAAGRGARISLRVPTRPPVTD